MNKTSIPTVNVVEYFNNSISQIISFPDNEEGNTQAEKLFKEILLEGLSSPEDIEYQVENGIYDDDNGYQVSIIHSTQVILDN